MRITKSVVFGLMGLLYTVNATKATGKPVLAKRQAVVTVTTDGCTAVCVDLSSMNLGGGTECDIFCDGGSTTSLLATSTLLSPCVIEYSTTTETSTSTSTETSIVTTITTTIEPALNPRTLVSASGGDCKALCWDLKPGSTECDVQCSSDFKTKASGNVAHPSGANAPSKAARVANLEARENVQAHEVREARLARKFGGHVARDDTTTVDATTVTVEDDPDELCTVRPESFISTTIAGSPTILPMQVPQKAGASDISAALSHAASAALSFAQATPSAASSALSEASESLSAMAAAAPISANATSVTTASTGSASTTPKAPTGSANTTTKVIPVSPTPTVLATTTAISTSSETTTTSATITPSASFPGVSEAGTIASGVTSTIGDITSTIGGITTTIGGVISNIPTAFEGAASEYTVSTGLVLSLLVGLAANVAFLI